MKYTEHLKLELLEYADDFDTEILAKDFTTLDTKIKNLERGGGVATTPYDLKTLAQIVNRTYEGVDLTVKFADEISKAPYNGNEWAWIKARIQAANWEGIWVGDYIPFSAGGYNFKAEIAGIDTYYRYGDTMVPHHIDFICRELWPEAHVFNKVNFNNGTSVNSSPWLASDLYHWLNGLQGQVPNSATANPTMVAVDYRTTGVYNKLPQKLKDVLIEKRLLLPNRYTTGQLLVDDNSWALQNTGKLWIPSEVEVYGYSVWGTVVNDWQGYSQGGYQLYPLFICNMKRVKFLAGVDETASNRSIWWLSTARGASFINCASVGAIGNASNDGASTGNRRTPICFRVA